MQRQKNNQRGKLRFKAQVGNGLEEEFEVEALEGRLPDREELIELILDHFELDGEIGRGGDGAEVARRNRDRTHVLWNRTNKTECDDVDQIGWGDRLVVADRSTAGTTR
jgi:hypothetical protein